MSGTDMTHWIRLRHVMGTLPAKGGVRWIYSGCVAERMFCNAEKSSVNHVVRRPQITRAR